MSLKQVKEQLAALKDEIGRQSGREWITIKVPADANDETINAWLDDAVGSDWRRHVIVRIIRFQALRPSILERVPVAETAGMNGMVFSAEEAGLL